MRALIAEPHLEKRRAGELQLRQLGCCVSSASDQAQTFRLALASERPALIVISTLWPEDDGLSLCSDIRRRHVSKTQPQIVLLGPSRSELHLLEGLHSGANDWIRTLQPRAFSHHVRAASVLNQASADTVLVEFLRTLTDWDSGILRVDGADLRGRIEISRGRIGRVALERTACGFETLVQRAVGRTPPEVSAWLRVLGDAPRDYRKALLDWGFWDRARLRGSLQHSFRHDLRVLCRIGAELSFESCPVSCARELSFAPDELLADELPHSYRNPRLSFLTCEPDNDVTQAEVS